MRLKLVKNYETLKTYRQAEAHQETDFTRKVLIKLERK